MTSAAPAPAQHTTNARACQGHGSNWCSTAESPNRAQVAQASQVPSSPHGHPLVSSVSTCANRPFGSSVTTPLDLALPALALLRLPHWHKDLAMNLECLTKLCNSLLGNLDPLYMMESGIQKPRIQLTGFKNQEKKTLVELLLRLDCVFLDSEQYRNCTHLIAKQPCKSEKFLAACAAGKWILTKDYIINSAESGRWLDETTYEWGYKIETGSHYSPQMQSAPKRWREELTRSGATGAFHRWKVVLLVVKGDKRRDSLTRLLEAGKATICSVLNTPKNITHILTNNSALNQEKAKRLFGAPYYPVRYLGSYLLEASIFKEHRS
ncbi:hypothetical protein lerEdw1_000323 [Lerista edwardsae]|nr:hypothetical protein lerEdw1_000323 [Lerista edwardsae]